MTDCLDSWAILSWLEGNSPASDRVEIAMQTRPIMSWINLGEVSYILERRAGLREAQRVIQILRPQLMLDLPSESRVLAAARLKAQFPLAYADAFAIATAVAHKATLLTGDPEIINGDPKWPILDLR